MRLADNHLVRRHPAQSSELAEAQALWSTRAAVTAAVIDDTDSVSLEKGDIDAVQEAHLHRGAVVAVAVADDDGERQLGEDYLMNKALLVELAEPGLVMIC